MPSLCDDFSHILMSLTSSMELHNVAVFSATIDSIDRELNTATVTYTTFPMEPLDYPDLISVDVPFFYHCEYSNGSAEDLLKGNKAFIEGDAVFVLHFYGANLIETGNTYIVGHSDIEDTRTCLTDFLKISLVIARSADNNPTTNEEYVTIFDVSAEAVISDGITFPRVADSVFDTWFDTNMEIVNSSETPTGEAFRRNDDSPSSLITDISYNYITPFVYDAADSCVTATNYLVCWRDLIEGGGTKYSEQTTDFDDYTVPLSMIYDEQTVNRLYNTAPAPETQFSPGVLMPTDCDSVSYDATNVNILESRKHPDGVSGEQTKKVIGYCSDFVYNHYFTSSSGEFFCVHRSTLEQIIVFDELYTNVSVYTPPDGNCTGGGESQATQSFDLLKEWSDNYEIYTPWDPNALVPFFEAKATCMQIGDGINDYLNFNGTLEVYTVYTGLYTATYDAHSFEINYATGLTHHADKPLLVNSSDIVVGVSGTYGIICCCAFQDVVHESYQDSTYANTRIKRSIRPTNLINSYYSYDNYIKATECAINTSTTIADPITGDTIMDLGDFSSSSPVAIKITNATDALLEYLIATEYPIGPLTRAEAVAARGGYWRLEIELCKFK